MPTLVRSVSPVETLQGLAVTALVALVASFLALVGAPLVAAPVAILGVLASARGVKPLSATHLYRLLLGATVALVGAAMIVAEGPTALPVGLVVAGLAWALFAARQAFRGGGLTATG